MRWRRSRDKYGRMTHIDPSGQYRITRMTVHGGGYILYSPDPKVNRSFAYFRDAKRVVELELGK